MNRDKMLEAMMKAVTDAVVDVNVEEILAKVYPQIDEKIHETYGFLPEVHEVRTPTATHKICGTTHEKFDEVLNIVNLDIPVYLTGKAGTGKNVICQQVAEALGLDFYFTNAVTQEYKLTGFIDANGNYQETQFYKAFTKGGLFFLDEMDASIPETLIILNAPSRIDTSTSPTVKLVRTLTLESSLPVIRLVQVQIITILVAIAWIERVLTVLLW